MYTDNPIFDRARLLMGDDVMQTIASRRVIIFGAGGVGSWVAECLIRSGIRHLTIVDSDRICASNVNRQLMATSLTVGEVKVDALRRHLLEISPDADILALPAGASFDLIVSNPPYICRHERAEMASHVTAHEPALALFVPDDDPQRFYRALAALAHRRLISGGALMVEAHSRYADATAAVMREAGLSDVAVHPDIFGLPRFVSARLG